tara:strand:+ start:490 stop:975 length:486 start_codon:yes stop_codon:yes gene_type:complete
MNYLKVSLCVLALLCASRFIPHPPNFTSLIALSFYIPLLFGVKFIPVVVLSLIFTDIFLGFHSIILFTWGSVILIGLISKKFSKSPIIRLLGATSGATIFFITSNFGVWLSGSYGYNMSGLIECYIMAIPFFGNTVISTLIFSFVIECLNLVYNYKLKISK